MGGDGRWLVEAGSAGEEGRETGEVREGWGEKEQYGTLLFFYHKGYSRWRRNRKSIRGMENGWIVYVVISSID